MKTKLLILSALVAVAFSANAQWRQQNTNMVGTSVGVDNIFALDSNIVWVNGFNGSATGGKIKVHARTNDGGETWVPGTYNGMGAKVYPRVIAGSSYTNAFAIAMDTATSVASFWKTTDGGANWSIVTGVMNDGTNTFADGVSFWDATKGFCYGDPVAGKFDIYYTTDGGSSWTPTIAGNVAPPITGEYGYNGAECASKASNGVAAFITNKGRIYKTTNYGVNWDTTAVAPFASCPYSAQIFISNANFMIVANMPTQTSTTYDWKYTTDGGATWATYAAASGSFYTYQMCYVPGTANMFVSTSPFSGTTGVGYANDGLNWFDFTDPIFLQDASAANLQMLGVSFTDENNGWVGNYNYFGGYNSILRYQKNNATIYSVVASPIEANGALDAGTITGEANYTVGASVTLTAVANTGYVFEKWISYPDQADAGTATTLTFTMPASNKAYLAQFMVDPNVAVAENDFGKLLVSPNPATNNVTIALNSKLSGVFNVNIVDVTGKSIYTNSLEANSTLNMDVTAFAKGVYFVKINNNKTQLVQKLIVK